MHAFESAEGIKILVLHQGSITGFIDDRVFHNTKLRIIDISDFTSVVALAISFVVFA